MIRMRRKSRLITARTEEQSGISAVGELLADETPPNDATGPYQLVAPDGRTISLPEPLVRILRGSADHLSQSAAVAVLPIEQQLTIAEAADLLNLTLPQLKEVLARGELTHTNAPDGGRIAVPDLLAYKDRRDQEEDAALDELARQAEELELYV